MGGAARGDPVQPRSRHRASGDHGAALQGCLGPARGASELPEGLREARGAVSGVWRRGGSGKGKREAVALLSRVPEGEWPRSRGRVRITVVANVKGAKGG